MDQQCSISVSMSCWTAISSFILPPASVSNRLSAYLYKIEHDPKGHKRSFLKIIDGSLRLRDIVRINDSEKFIKIKNLKTIYQGREINVDEVGANDIAIVEDIERFSNRRLFRC